MLKSRLLKLPEEAAVEMMPAAVTTKVVAMICSQLITLMDHFLMEILILLRKDNLERLTRIL